MDIKFVWRSYVAGGPWPYGGLGGAFDLPPLDQLLTIRSAEIDPLARGACWLLSLVLWRVSGVRFALSSMSLLDPTGPGLR